MEKYWELKKTLPNTTNQEVVGDFLLSLKLANCSPLTIDLYRCFLERFFGEWNEPFSSLSSDEIHEWYRQYEGDKKDTTLKLRLSILSSFYTFCVQEGLIEQSPMKSRWFPRLSQPIPKYLNKKDIAKTRQQAEQTTVRNQAIVELMLTSGCRVSELISLNQSDVDLENRTAHVIGKGRKIREVHFSEKCAVLIERYVSTKQKKDGALFVSSTTGKRLGVRIVQKMINAIGKEAGMDTRLYPHRLRHTFATELLSKGAELSFIADELGHANIGTTQIYARLPKQEIIALYRKFMG